MRAGGIGMRAVEFRARGAGCTSFSFWGFRFFRMHGFGLRVWELRTFCVEGC